LLIANRQIVGIQLVDRIANSSMLRLARLRSWADLKPTKEFEQDGHDQRRIEKLVGNHSETESRVPVMHKEVIVGVPHLIENKQPNEHERNALYGQSIEQKGKTHHMQDDIHFPCVIRREEKLRLLQKRHTASLIQPSVVTRPPDRWRTSLTASLPTALPETHPHRAIPRTIIDSQDKQECKRPVLEVKRECGQCEIEPNWREWTPSRRADSELTSARSVC
jgi:hypothetical protein